MFRNALTKPQPIQVAMLLSSGDATHLSWALYALSSCAAAMLCTCPVGATHPTAIHARLELCSCAARLYAPRCYCLPRAMAVHRGAIRPSAMHRCVLPELCSCVAAVLCTGPGRRTLCARVLCTGVLSAIRPNATCPPRAMLRRSGALRPGALHLCCMLRVCPGRYTP